MQHTIPACPVDIGDRVSTPADTIGVVQHAFSVPLGSSPLVPSRWQPGRWLAGVWETEGVEQSGIQPFDAASRTRIL